MERGRERREEKRARYNRYLSCKIPATQIGNVAVPAVETPKLPVPVCLCFSSASSSHSPPAMDGHFVDGAHRSLSSLSLPGQHGSGKRRLLLVYIHGFMGSEASFHDLPAHVHDLLTGMLSESHVVYTRIYPRYKSHGEIQTAVNQFSAWYVIHCTTSSQDHGLIQISQAITA